MDDLRLQAVAARVVAWHNRHPLARRIRTQQVRSIGYVALSVAEAADALPPPEATAASWASNAVAAAALPAEDNFSAAFAAMAEHQAGVAPAPVAEPASAAAAVLDEADAVTGDPDARPEPAFEPDRAAQAAVPLPGAPHIPTLRDRVLVRSQQPEVQGALLAAHGSYSPTPQTPALRPSTAADPGDGEHFMAPLSPRDLARWVARHGRALVQPPLDGPIRRVATVAGGPLSGTTYVLTAAIAGGGLTARVLVGTGSAGHVLGTRLWSVPRVASAAALVGLLLLGAVVSVVLAWRPAAPALAATGLAPAAAVPAAISAASAASAAPAAQGAAAPPAASAASAAEADVVAPPAPPAASAAAPALPESRPSTAQPLPADAHKGAVRLASPGLPLSEVDKAAARAAVAAARAGRTATPVAPVDRATAPPSAADASRSAGPAPAASAAPAGPAYAVSTRSLRTRAEAEQVQMAMVALLRSAGVTGGHVDLLPEGDDWRVVAWPFSGSADADRYRVLLAGRGMKVEVLRF